MSINFVSHSLTNNSSEIGDLYRNVRLSFINNGEINMKKSKTILLLIFLFCLSISPTWANSQKNSNNIYIHITKGITLCEEFKDILDLPENSNHLMSSMEAETFIKTHDPETFWIDRVKR